MGRKSDRFSSSPQPLLIHTQLVDCRPFVSQLLVNNRPTDSYNVSDQSVGQLLATVGQQPDEFNSVGNLLQQLHQKGKSHFIRLSW